MASKSYFTVFLFAMFSSEMLMAYGRMCESPSDNYKGFCFLDGNCNTICKSEGFAIGKCSFPYKCVCHKECDKLNDLPEPTPKDDGDDQNGSGSDKPSPPMGKKHKKAKSVHSLPPSQSITKPNTVASSSTKHMEEHPCEEPSPSPSPSSGDDDDQNGSGSDKPSPPMVKKHKKAKSVHSLPPSQSITKMNTVASSSTKHMEEHPCEEPSSSPSSGHHHAIAPSPHASSPKSKPNLRFLRHHKPILVGF